MNGTFRLMISVLLIPWLIVGCSNHSVPLDNHQITINQTPNLFLAEHALTQSPGALKSTLRRLRSSNSPTSGEDGSPESRGKIFRELCLGVVEFNKEPNVSCQDPSTAEKRVLQQAMAWESGENSTTIANLLTFLSATSYQYLLKEADAFLREELRPYCQEKRPSVHNIGQTATLTYEQGAPLRIPIDGLDMHPKCTTFSLTVTGDIPLGERSSEIEVSPPSSETPDIASVKILPTYLSRLSGKGENLTLQIALAERGFLHASPENERAVAFATRTFRLYDREQFEKNIRSKRVDLYDLQAYPLPEEEREYLFGPLVRESYFAVRITVMNPRDESILITTGAIHANGRAMVVATHKGRETKFTIPVSLSPQSSTQMYTILDDQSVNQTREQVFRGLEFVGALAMAGALAYQAADSVTKGIGLFTGVVTPGLRKAFPDPWINYKRNIVNLSMADLVKIPPRGTTAQKYLFFSKKNIESIITDSQLFQRNIDQNADLAVIPPKVQVISIAFDNIDVPFETVASH